MPSRSSNQRDLRLASHADSWYTGDAEQLNAQLSKWLEDAIPVDGTFPIAGSKAVIAPHAGYSYSGPAAAWAYKSIDTTGIKRVFILGPSHHYYLEGCALSGCKEYETPIGNLPLDIDTIAQLKATGQFEDLSIDADEAEHSLEMHLPYVRKVFKDHDVKIVPIVVGNISQLTEAAFGKVLAPYLAKEDTFFVISSDFCHWGTRFHYTFYYPEPSPSDTPGIRLTHSSTPASTHPIHMSISRLDREGMDVLTLPQNSTTSAHQAFSEYLRKTKNTICGRHPIGVLLGALSELEKESEHHPTLKWVRYEQSSACMSIRDSSVSYASAWVKL